MPFIKDIAIIAENGGVVDYKGIEFFTKVLPNSILEELISFTDQNNTYPIINTRYISYLFPRIKKHNDKIAHYCTNLKYIEKFSEILGDVVSISIFVEDEKVVPVFEKLQEKWKDEVIFVITGKYWIDIVPRDVNKGNALKELMEKLDIKKEEVMAFGDYNNDIEMLALSEKSYAMNHASSEVKAHAKYICSPDEIMSIIQKEISHNNCKKYN
ncbi:hypothetical protein AN642_02905 [Epulopiscium sp. SCG-B10WGA-EpuloA2]|nr:hypothetical protein AN642_02905 [Epulopiscium sp. SCG-B10WGA-EpuloA2]